ncbi:hypothetical protein FACS189421_14220 [Bacteroidia bacterium]|nr:hypothetical protein FACS189421_14220 [Bacteroidia bacterium]
MEIQLPENIDLSHSERYLLAIDVRQDQFAFFLYCPDESRDYFYYRIPVEQPAGAFLSFRNAFFDNSFFTLPFKKTIIINSTPLFTYVPNLIFEEKDKEEYLRFLCTAVDGKILCQTLPSLELSILHEMPEEIYGFFQRSFTDVRMIHRTAVLMDYFLNRESAVGNRMFIHHQGKELDILCFSNDKLLLGNHFHCSQSKEAVYYILYIWKQLKFNQLKDTLHIAGEAEDLQEKMGKYIRTIVPVTIPFEQMVLSHYE